MVRDFLAKGDAMMRAAAAAALPELTTDDLTEVAADLRKLPVASQVSILSAVRIRGDRKLLDVALEGLDQSQRRSPPGRGPRVGRRGRHPRCRNCWPSPARAVPPPMPRGRASTSLSGQRR